MPFTYFHLGPAILLGIILMERIDLPTFLAANVIVDWKAALVYLGLIQGPRHSWVHTYLGSIFVGIILYIIMTKININERLINKALNTDLVTNKRKIFFAALLGVIIHVSLDAFHHPSMTPFYPSQIKPLYGILNTAEVRTICLTCLIAAIPTYIIKERNSI